MWTASELSKTKQELLLRCHTFIDERIRTIRAAMSAAQDSANDETKSSAGDKYETTRAMMQIEIEQNAKQLTEANKQKAVLNQINPTMLTDFVLTGNLVITDNGNFCLAVSVGQVQLEGKSFMVVSAQSPVGSKLIGSKVGDVVSFANKHYTIALIG
jgi:transcription elongation GreA/GreB family factor